MKAKDIKNKQIVTRDSGEQIYRVNDVIFDPEAKNIPALIAENSTLFSQVRILPYKNIQSIGPDAIVVASREAVVSGSEVPEIEKLIDPKRRVRGKRVISEDGVDLGEIDDIVFDEKDGMITGFEVSGGVAQDIYRGRPYLPVPKLLKVGRDVVFVPADTVEMIKKQTGGIKAAAEKAGRKTEEYSRQVSEKAKEAYSKAREKAPKYAHEYTEGEQGTAIKEKAKNTWQSIKQTANEWWDKAVDETEQRRINAAIGRPVTRVIYDRDDKLILNTGDLITHEAIDQARQAGMLPVLLDSVYKGEPKFSEEEMRAQEDEDRHQ